jgi:hypothetical protein
VRVSVRPATRADLDYWHPGETCSFRAWVAELDGVSSGIVGLSLTRPVATLFSAFDEALRPHLRHHAVLRAIRRAHRACIDSGAIVAALCSPTEPASPKLLRRMGFEPWGVVDGDDVWMLKGK